MMIPAAHRLARRYRDLRVPTLIMAGQQDHLVTANHHSARLHKELPGSVLRIIPRGSHMVHHEVPDLIATALSEFCALGKDKAQPVSGHRVDSPANQDS
jgi:pimeloyl-ACP methyl ester carboxylesterase